jgi:anti-anti-sigma factor
VSRRHHDNRNRNNGADPGRRRPTPHDSRSAGKGPRIGDASTHRAGGSALEPLEHVPVPPLHIETTKRENTVLVHLRGEADLGNHEQLRSGLLQVRLDGADAVHLMLSELTFCDLCALRHLVAFAGRVREAGRQLSAHGARPTIKKVAGLVNVAHELHFV